MDEFEEKLRKLPLREPRAELDERIGELLGAGGRRAVSIGLRHVAAIGILSAGAGFVGGWILKGTAETEDGRGTPSVVAVEVVYHVPGSPDPFDLTSRHDREEHTPWEASIDIRNGGER